jgi:aminoglycoside 3'-phosphotransferase I
VRTVLDLDRESRCGPPALPDDWAAALSGCNWSRNLVGEAGAAVYRLSNHPNALDLFLKHGSGPVAIDVIDEMVRLRWLSAYVPVPTVVRFATAAQDAWLLTTAVPGKTAYQLLAANPEQGVAIVEVLADFLRRLHAVPVDRCPFTSDHAHRMALARERIDAGLVDGDDFDDEREGWSAEQVWQALGELLPLSPDPVATHGDYSLDNVLLEGGTVTGCIDVGRAGSADRYQDLAIMWNCLGEFGEDLQQRFLQRYGITSVDERKLQFHLLLDELF